MNHRGREDRKFPWHPNCFLLKTGGGGTFIDFFFCSGLQLLLTSQVHGWSLPAAGLHRFRTVTWPPHLKSFRGDMAAWLNPSVQPRPGLGGPPEPSTIPSNLSNGSWHSNSNAHFNQSGVCHRVVQKTKLHRRWLSYWILEEGNGFEVLSVPSKFLISTHFIFWSSQYDKPVFI